MHNVLKPIYFVVFLAACSNADAVLAQIKQSSASGFTIEIQRELDVDAKTAYSKLINDFSKWYDTSHSYSQNPDNLSLDVDKQCMYEKLDNGGFVRHMEIVFHRPGKVLRMTGGLGPLQGMGVNGAWTFLFSEEGGKATLLMTYAVSGADFLNLDKIAPPVNEVLSGQMTRFQNWCNTGNPTPKEKPANSN